MEENVLDICVFTCTSGMLISEPKFSFLIYGDLLTTRTADRKGHPTLEQLYFIRT